MKNFQPVLLLAALWVSAPALADRCDVYHDAITDCAAKDGCDTTIDSFAACLVEKHGITDKADDGVDEIKELVHCFQTQYHCASDGK